MKKLIVAIVLLSVTVASADWTANLMGNTDHDIVAGIGTTLFDYQAEIGLGMTAYNRDDAENKYDITVGPYIAMPMEIPWEWGKDVGTYVGVSPQFHMRTFKPSFELFAAAILYPQNHVSPILLVRYNWLDGDLKDTAIEPGGMLIGGLRIRF